MGLRSEKALKGLWSYGSYRQLKIEGRESGDVVEEGGICRSDRSLLH